MNLIEWMFGKKTKPVEAKPWPYKLTVCIDRVKYEYRETRKFKERIRGKNHEIRLSNEEFYALVEDVRAYYDGKYHYLSSCTMGFNNNSGVTLVYNSYEIVPFYDNEWVSSWY